jgi:hypothetical protein
MARGNCGRPSTPPRGATIEVEEDAADEVFEEVEGEEVEVAGEEVHLS